MAEVYLGLGSNIGEKATNLRVALRLLTRAPGSSDSDSEHEKINLLAVSSLYRTDPVGYLDQDWFLNAAVRIETDLSPRELLARLIAVERQLGRVRTVRNGPRIVDLDILLWHDLVVQEEDLVIPHARMHERLFVLEPLSEIAAGVPHPLLGITVAQCLAQLAARCDDAPGVFRIDGPQWTGDLNQ